MRTAVTAIIVANGLLWAATSAFAASDRDFITKAMQGDNSETTLGTLAEQQGASAQTRDFGRMLREDHSKSKQDVMPVAQHLGVPQTDAMAPEAIKEQAKLQKLHGSAFDREFAGYMVKDHKKDIADFKQEAAHGKDSAVRSLAQKTLPVLQKHLKTADQLKQSL